MNDNYYFKLFADCIPVKGAKRSTICDLGRGGIRLIPDDLLEILVSFQSHTVKEIKAAYNNDSDNIIDEYFAFLIEHEYGFFCESMEELELFPDLDTRFDLPYPISNAIVDVDDNSDFNYEEIFSQLKELMCPYLQLRFYSIQSFESIKQILSHTSDKDLCSIELILMFNERSFSPEEIMVLDRDFAITKIIFHSVPEDFECKKSATEIKTQLNLVYCNTNITGHSFCGIIHPNYFTINIQSFTESLGYNSCLNRKIGIDVNGNIKNCPSAARAYGNIKNRTLSDVLEKTDFKKYWNISKDQITVCQDCEFRHICTDCRAYLEIPENEYSKPLKCGYDPYTCQWTDWSTNPLKQKAIHFYENRV